MNIKHNAVKCIVFANVLFVLSFVFMNDVALVLYVLCIFTRIIIICIVYLLTYSNQKLDLYTVRTMKLPFTINREYLKFIFFAI